MTFQDLNQQNYFKKNPNEDPSQLWYNLLNYLQEEPKNLITNEDSGEEGTPFNFIQSHIDLPETNLESTGFFDDIYDSLTSSLPFNQSVLGYYDIDSLDNWDDYYWNESVARAMQHFYCVFDKNGIVNYEKDFLYEKEDGTIDELRLQGGIKNTGYYDSRVIDIAESDAGNNFIREEDMYEYYDYISGYTLTISCYVKERYGQVFPCTPVSIVLDKEEILEIMPENFSKIFNKQGKLWANVVDRLNLTGDHAPGKTNEGKGWEGKEILKDLYDNFHIEMLTKHKGDVIAFENFLRETDESGKVIRKNYYFRGKGEANVIKIKKVVNPWVIPWYNLQGFTYKHARTDDLKRSVMSNGENNLVDRRGNGIFNKFLNFTHSHFARNYSEDFQWLYNRLLMPEYKRKVEIEDLNRNFWTIGQTITSIMNYVLGDGGPYKKTIGNILNEVMQLWENVLFLWAQIAVQSQKKPDIHAEVVYINLEELNDELFYDFNLDFNDDTFIDQRTDSESTVHYKHRMLENSTLTEAVIRYLRKYRLQYKDYNVSLFPIIRLNNYKSNYYTRSILLGEYKYCYNWEDLSLDVYDERVPGLVPVEQEGQKITIDGKDVFCINFFDTKTVPALRDYHLCQFEESFFSYAYAITDGTPKSYVVDVDVRDYLEYLYGIVENSDEETYTGGVPLIDSALIKTDSGQQAWGLISLMTDIEIVKEPLSESIEEDYPIGLWSTKLCLYGIDVSKFLLTKKSRSHVLENDIIFSYTYDINISEAQKYEINDICGKVIPEQYKTFKQIQAIDNEFGYYKGELLTTFGNTTKADFDLIDLGQILLHPSPYQSEDYSYYYGADDADEIIKKEVIDDEYALTNYLDNVYDNWIYGSDKEAFWESRSDKINLPEGEQWEENRSEIIGYKQEGENIVPILKSRSEINQSIDNKDLVWPDFNEDWQEDAINKLNINSSQVITPLTIFFVEGRRHINFTPRRGDGQLGDDITALDGLLHHEWSSDSHVKAAGAAVRLPSINRGVSYIFYPRHSNPTIANRNMWDHYRKIDEFAVKRMANVVMKKTEVMTTISYLPSDLDGISSDFRTLCLRTKNGNNYNWLVNRISVNYSGWGDTYLILKKDSEAELTEDNWLINHVHYNNVNHAQYFIPLNKDDLNGWEYNFRKVETPRTYDKKANCKVASILGEEMAINALSNEHYYKQLYQRYIYYKWNIAAGGQDKIDKYLCDNDITIEKVLYNQNSAYYLKLNQTMFGWMKIIDSNNNEYTAKFHVDSPFVYSDLPSEDIIFIETNIRNNSYDGSINKIFTSSDGTNTIKTFIELINDMEDDTSFIYWDTRPASDITILKAYGNISTHFGTNISGKDDEETQQNLWMEDRIMLAQFESLFLVDQELLFNADGNIWPNQKLIDAMSMHSGLWYDENENNQLQKIEKLIRPLEGSLSSSITLTLPNSDPAITYSISDKFYLNSSVIDTIQNYVFGPNSLEKKYARRSIYRYSDYSNNDESTIRNTIGNNSGKWAARPVAPTLSSDINMLWYDDYDITDITIDQIRQGYSVYQIIGDDYSWQIEKYKTYRNKNADDLARAQSLGYAEIDDLDFNNIFPGLIYPNG